MKWKDKKMLSTTHTLEIVEMEKKQVKSKRNLHALLNNGECRHSQPTPS